MTDSGAMVLRFAGEEVARVPIAPVSEARRSTSGPGAESAPALPVTARDVAAADRSPGALKRLLGSPDLASQALDLQQYDHMVMADTVQRPGGDAAVIRIHGSRSGDRADHRLHAALLRRRPAPRRQAGGRRGLAQPRARSARGRSRSPTA